MELNTLSGSINCEQRRAWDMCTGVSSYTISSQCGEIAKTSPDRQK